MLELEAGWSRSDQHCGDSWAHPGELCAAVEGRSALYPHTRTHSLQGQVHPVSKLSVAATSLQSMTPHAIPEESPDGFVPTQFSADLADLGTAINRLGGHTSYIMRSLTEMLRAMRPVNLDRGLSGQQEQYLIESGAYTAESLTSASREVNQGVLQLSEAKAWLASLCATISLEEAAGFLEEDEESVRASVNAKRLHAVVVSGRLRFPIWQLSLGSQGKILPNLDQIIEAVTPQGDWQSVAGFMTTPQGDLVGEGRMTPIEWLRSGGDVDTVRAIIESAFWR